MRDWRVGGDNGLMVRDTPRLIHPPSLCDVVMTVFDLDQCANWVSGDLINYR